MLLHSNYQAPCYSPQEWFADGTVPPKNTDELAKAIVLVAKSRFPGNEYSCFRIDYFPFHLFPEIPSSSVVLELDRQSRIVPSDAIPSRNEIRWSDVPEEVRHRRRIGDPWYIVEAFIVVRS